jgi:hypothetical protein
MLHEPATFFTDLILAALAAWITWRLHTQLPVRSPAAHWWIWALGLTAASAFCGGCYHGFGPELPRLVARAWWILTLLLISLTGAAMALSLVEEMLPPGRKSTGRWFVGAKLAIAVVAVFILPRFIVVLVDYGLVLLAWAACAIAVSRPWRGLVLAGVGLSVMAGLIQALRWAPAPWFNHNDLYHLVQAGALVAFYRAVRLLSLAAPVTRAGP